MHVDHDDPALAREPVHAAATASKGLSTGGMNTAAHGVDDADGPAVGRPRDVGPRPGAAGDMFSGLSSRGSTPM